MEQANRWGALGKYGRFLALLFVISFLVRALVFSCYLSKQDRYWQVDSATYHRIATNFALDKNFPGSDSSPQFYRLPGYPMFLALWYSIFGPNKVVALWMQVFLASFIPLFIFMLGLVLFHKRLIAYVASWWSVFHLGLILYAGFFMTESLFIIFFFLFLILFLRNLGGQKPGPHKSFYVTSSYSGMFFMPEDSCQGESFIRFYEETFDAEWQVLRTTVLSFDDVQHQEWAYYHRLVYAGLALGVASLIRPVGHYLLVLSILMLIVANSSWRERIVQSGIFTFSWFLPVSFWLLRNFLLTGCLFFHTLPGGHFLYLSAARVAMHVHDTSYQQARTILSAKVDQEIERFRADHGRQPREIESCIIKEKLALRYFMMRPVLTIRFWVTDIIRTTLSLYSAEIVYLESGRKSIDYFNKNRGWKEIFGRYFFVETDFAWVKFVVWGEIVCFMLLLIGFLGWCVQVLRGIFPEGRTIFCSTIPFILLFLVISLAGGYARMRLPIEPIMIILSSAFWVSLFKSKEFYGL